MVLLLTACGTSGEAPGPEVSTVSTSAGGASSSAGSAPVSRVFQTSALQDGVRRILSDTYGLADVTGVRCPEQQAVQVGISFDCEASVGGVPKTVTLTVQTPDGTYAVARPK